MTGKRGHVVKAYVVASAGRDGNDALITELQDYVKSNAAPYMYPRVISFESELPKTINGKILRSELRARAISDGGGNNS